MEKAKKDELIKMIAEKNAAAMLYAVNSKPLNKLDRNLQHIIYKFKYSKLRDK